MSADGDFENEVKSTIKWLQDELNKIEKDEGDHFEYLETLGVAVTYIKLAQEWRSASVFGSEMEPDDVQKFFDLSSVIHG